MTGKRPIWADHTDSVFYFAWAHVRFVEIPPGSTDATTGSDRNRWAVIGAIRAANPPVVVQRRSSWYRSLRNSVERAGLRVAAVQIQVQL